MSNNLKLLNLIKISILSTLLLQAERQKNKEAMGKLDESITLLEKQLAEQKRQSDKVVAAEIKSR